MRPGSEAAGTRSASRPRRGVRLFVAVHLAAVGAIYATALAVGGGWVGPPMPPVLATAAAPPAVASAQSRSLPALASARTVAPASPPAWTRAGEIAPPWESR